ncbi:hypothetical protein [Spiroplasma endosymbiont of Aspidapion aeneum]|uniref:hypothetical protein n=1 Tax=Spiroplasma endosymbiont of Aspidapion aeneum TaxID=3066276 RepID=UPI00313D7BF0
MFNEKNIENKFLEEIAKKKELAIENKDFILFKEKNKHAAEQLDDKINNFFSASNFSTVKQIPLPKPIKDEIAYFNFISERYDEVSLSQKLDVMRKKLEDFDSPFYMYIDTMKQKIDNGYIELRGRDWLNEFFRTWTFMLNKRILDFRLKAADDLRYDFLVEIYEIIRKYESYSKIYQNFYDVFGKNVEIDEELDKKNIDSVAKFADYLYKDPSILKIVELLGRLNGEDDKFEKNITEQIVTYPTYKKLPTNPEEIVGVTASNNIERIMPSELVNLFDPELEVIFYKKFVESELQTLLFESREVVIEHDIEEVEYEAPIPIDQGKFIICIDTSSSMEGAGEYIAKALALAVVKVALKGDRDIVIYNFAQDVEEFTILARKLNIDKLLKFISKSFYGLTNASPAFDQIMDKMWEEDFKRADLLMISDFMLNSMSNVQRLRLTNLKQKYNRFHSLVVGGMPNIASQDIFDNVMYYDPDDPESTSQIVKSLNETLDNLRELKEEEIAFRDEQIAKLNQVLDKRRNRKVVEKQTKAEKAKLERKKKEKAKAKLDKLKQKYNEVDN